MPPRSATFSDAIDDFVAHRKAMGVTKTTVAAEERLLRRMLAQIGNVQLRNLKERHVDEYYLTRQTQLATSSWNQELSQGRIFFKWCERRRLLGPEGNPIAHRGGRKFVPRPRLRIPANDFPRLLDSAPNPRDRIVCALGVYLLLRQSEIGLLRLGHVNLATGEIAVAIEKTGQRDVMPICLELEEEIRRWLTAYGDDVARPLQDDDFLVPAGTKQLFGQPNPRKYVPTKPMVVPHRAVQRTLLAAGYDTRDPDTGRSNLEGVHTLRRSAARAIFDQLVADGYDGAMRHVQAMLHHKSAAMTEHYLGLELDVQRRNDMVRGRRLYKVSGENVTALRAVK